MKAKLAFLALLAAVALLVLVLGDGTIWPVTA